VTRRAWQVTAVQVQCASGNNCSAQQSTVASPTMSPAMSSFCRSIVQNTLFSDQNACVIPFDDDVPELHRTEQDAKYPPCDAPSVGMENSTVALSRSRDLSPCLDTSPVHNGKELTPNEDADAVRRDALDACHEGNGVLGGCEEAAASVALWSLSQPAGIASWSFPRSTTSTGHVLVSEVDQSTPANAIELHHAASSPATITLSSGFNQNRLSGDFEYPQACEDPSLPPNVSSPPSTISSNASSVLQFPSTAADNRGHKWANDYPNRVTSADTSYPAISPPVKLAIQKLQLDKVRQESQVSSQHDTRIHLCGRAWS
jgi:hypothetical protein